MKAAYVSYADFGGPLIHTKEFIRAFREFVPDLVLHCPYLDTDFTPGRDCAPSLFNRVFEHLPAWCRRIKLDFYQARKLTRDWLRRGEFTELYLDHGVDIVIIRNDAFVMGAFSAAVRAGIPIILETNGILSKDFPDRISRFFERFTHTRAAAVTAVSPQLAELLAPIVGDPSRIHVIPSGVRLEAFENVDISVVPGELIDALAGKTVVGYMGTFTQNHDSETFIRGFAEAVSGDRNIILLLMGEGRRDPAIREAIGRLGIEERVILTGWIPHPQVPAYLSLCDILANPLRQDYQEDFIGVPVKMFEYMAAGRAIISTDMPYVRELQKDTALYVPEGNPAAWSDAISHLTGDPLLRHSLGAAGQQLLEREGYTWRENARRVFTLCERVLGNRDAREENS